VTARVLVVGGGPAGLATATALARRGVDVALADAGAWNRPKMCGEFLSPDAERALDEIGAREVVRRLGAPSIDAVRATVARGGRVVADATSPLETPGRGLARVDLDGALADVARAAGVTLRERERVDSLTTDADGVRARTAAGEIAADAAVVATGRVPGVGRDDAAASRAWVAVKMHVRGLRLARVTELHFVRGAYVGLNEVACRGERVVDVCALACRAAWEKAGATPEGLWDWIARESPAFAERRIAADPIDGSFVAAAGFDFVVRGAHGRGERPPLFVGDAAALIAPLCGDGQAMALAGGASLGALLAARARRLDAAAVRDVARAWNREFRSRFRGRLLLGRALQTSLLRPRVASLVVRAASTSRPLGAWLYRRTRDGPAPRAI